MPFKLRSNAIKIEKIVTIQQCHVIASFCSSIYFDNTQIYFYTEFVCFVFHSIPHTYESAGARVMTDNDKNQKKGKE